MANPLELTAAQVRDRLWLKIGPPPRFTQLALAADIGVSLPFLNDILHGKRAPSGKVLDYLALERVVVYRVKRKSN